MPSFLHALAFSPVADARSPPLSLAGFTRQPQDRGWARQVRLSSSSSCRDALLEPELPDSGGAASCGTAPAVCIHLGALLLTSGACTDQPS